MLLIVVGCGDGPALGKCLRELSRSTASLWEGATLSFVPLPGRASTAPRSTAKMTYNGRAGLAPGNNFVSVSKTEDATPAGRRSGRLREGLVWSPARVEVPEEAPDPFALDFKSKSPHGENELCLRRARWLGRTWVRECPRSQEVVSMGSSVARVAGSVIDLIGLLAGDALPPEPVLHPVRGRSRASPWLRPSSLSSRSTRH